MIQYQSRIIVDPDIMLGKPVIKGTRITVEHILRKLSEGMSPENLLEAYPHLERGDVLAALAYSVKVIESEEMLVP